MLKPVTGFETDWVASTRWVLPMDDNPRRELIQVGPQDRPGGQLLLPGPIENLERSKQGNRFSHLQSVHLGRRNAWLEPRQKHVDIGDESELQLVKSLSRVFDRI